MPVDVDCLEELRDGDSAQIIWTDSKVFGGQRCQPRYRIVATPIMEAHRDADASTPSTAIHFETKRSGHDAFLKESWETLLCDRRGGAKNSEYDDKILLAMRELVECLVSASKTIGGLGAENRDLETRSAVPA